MKEKEKKAPEKAPEKKTKKAVWSKKTALDCLAVGSTEEPKRRSCRPKGRERILGPTAERRPNRCDFSVFFL
jgi:hypothetical protein